MLKASVAFGTSRARRFRECMTDSQSLLYSATLCSTLMELGIRHVWCGRVGGRGTLCLSLLISASVAPDACWSRSWGFVFAPTTYDMAGGWKRGCNVFAAHGRWIRLFIITEGNKWQSGREETLICSQPSVCLTPPKSNMIIASSFSLLSVSLKTILHLEHQVVFTNPVKSE